MSRATTPAVELRGLSKSYGAVHALRDVSLELYEGEVLGLVGDNGAGKTTLVKCVAGVHRPDAGELYVDGELRRDLTADFARELGIETVHQNLSLVDTLDVAQNFFLNRELVHRNWVARPLCWTNRRAMYRETREILAGLGLVVNPRRPVSALSGGQRQMIAVARAIHWGRHIVLLDEPAAALGVRQSMQVLQFVRSLSERGVAVLFISHNMQHVLRATTRIVVLRHGEKVGDVPTEATDAREIVTLITGSDMVVEGQDLGGLTGSRVAADVGGTFTDVLLEQPSGELVYHKLLSTAPDYDRAVVDGIRALLDGGDGVSEVVHGTTVATNAVLERRGGRTALVTTAGFRDVLELRRVRMPHLYDLFWNKPRPLVERRHRFEVAERVTAAGEILHALDEDEVRRLATRLAELDFESIAVCFLHAHRHPGHEELAGRILRAELPGVAVSLSSEILREQQEYERTAATVVNAYVRPLMGRYVENLRGGLAELAPGAPLQIMQSSGGIMTGEDAAARPVFALESGPAAGVVAALGLARQLGIENALAFDMGGTTAKASLIEGGRVARSREYEVGASLSAGSRLLRGSGELIRVPSIDIAEVGSGGGSLAWLDSAGGLHVGPHSAGAAPGPACYGRGGEDATTTDANVVLGYIPAGRLASGDLTVSRELAEGAVKRIAEPLGLSGLAAARGIHRLANASMMRALRSVSSEKGRDPAEFALVAYGGAGPIHAAALAEELGVRTVLVPPLAGLFSAAGLLFARTEFHDVRFCWTDARDPDLDLLRRLDEEMRGRLADQIGQREPLTWLRSADLRYVGQNWDVEVEFAGGLDAVGVAALVDAFEEEHERLYGVRGERDDGVEIRALRLAVLGPPPEERPFRVAANRGGDEGSRAADFGGGPVETPVRTRASIPGDPVRGPLLVDEYDTTVVVPPGWTVRRAESDVLVLERASDAARPDDEGAAAVARAIVGNALQSIADEMATTIFRTAHSTVVRDVMDFSAALCSPGGETVAQAVTIPLHLGSIPTAMRALLDRYGDELAPGDVYVMNDPFDGGIHTSDIYLVKPVFAEGAHVGFALAVAHHGDVGGRLPGTTACDNTEIFQEGIRIPWMRLVAAGEPVEDLFRLIRANVRIPAMTLGDIAAQLAACTVADRELVKLAARYGVERLASLQAALVDHSERLVRDAIRGWPDGSVHFVDWLDSDGIEVCDVKIDCELTIRGDELVADFSGSAPMVRGALNSTKSFVEASVYQAVMAAVEADLPPTSGAFRPITVLTKPGTVTHVVMPGASSMRGVTGFRVFDCLNGALAQLVPDRVPAAGEGGNTLAIFAGTHAGERFVYYELVVGTWGARPTADGNDGLSNPCATAANIPVEFAESEFPILVERYGLVQDSGGAGRYRGGLAIERAWRPLVPTTLQVRSDRQLHRPYGLAGGAAGGASANLLSTRDGAQPLPPMFSTELGAGMLYHHRMAGGGGFGDPLERDPGAVAEDVLDEKVSARAAREEYGVVFGPDGSPDARETEALRARLRAEREDA